MFTPEVLHTFKSNMQEATWVGVSIVAYILFRLQKRDTGQPLTQSKPRRRKLVDGSDMAPGAGQKERRNYNSDNESSKGWKRVDEWTVIWDVAGN